MFQTEIQRKNIDIISKNLQEYYDSLHDEDGNLQKYEKIIDNLFNESKKIIYDYIFNIPSAIAIYFMDNYPNQYPWDYRNRLCININFKHLQFKDNFSHRNKKCIKKLCVKNEDYYNNTKIIIQETYNYIGKIINQVMYYIKDWDLYTEKFNIT